MSITYLDYTIHLTDKDVVAANQAKVPQLHLPRNSSPGQWKDSKGLLSFDLGSLLTGEVYGGPVVAAARYSAPVITTKDEVASPCITSPWIVSHDQTTNPINVDDFEQPRGGFWGFIADIFNAKKFVWRGSFRYTPAAVSVIPDGSGGTVPVEAIAQRRFIEGFEHPEQGEGGTSGAGSLQFSRASSRHVEGMGLSIRSTDGVKSHTQAQYGAAASTKTWERFYIRAVAYPSADTTFWRTKSSAGVQGICLSLNSTGRVVLNDVDNSSVKTILATTTSPLVKGRWYRIDVFLRYGASAFAKLYINGVQQVSVVSFGAGGLATVANHASSEVGSTGQAANNLGLDIDDWMAAETPAVDGSGNLILTGNDWINGSKMIRIGANGFATDMSGWAGDWRSALQLPAEDATATLTSSTSGARLSLTTDAQQQIGSEPGSIGAAAIVVGKYGNRAGVDDGTLGFSAAGVEDVAAVTEFSSFEWATRMYRPAGMLTPAAVFPFNIIHEKGASASLATIYQFGAVAEMLGVFGDEDIVASALGATPTSGPGGTGIHNAPYPRTPWARAGVKPISPVVITSGTYTGNGSGQDLAFRTPIHWLWIRHVNSASNGTFWFSSMIAAHESVKESWNPAGAAAVQIDPAFVPATGSTADQGDETIVRITGADAQINQNGESYQYVAFSDPGMRFMLNGAIAWPFGSADRTHTLVNTNFLAEAAFLFQESLNGGSGVKALFKGLGHATQSLSNLGAAETASALAFSRGTLLSRSALHFAGAGQAIPFSLLRRDDGITDSGKVKVMQLVTYTGDGSSPRTIALTPASGVRPLFALVVPHDAASVARDPSHTGTISVTLPATNNSANGIRAGGIDSITVGSDLNTLNTVYDVFVIPGSTTAGGSANGFSENGEFAPVIPAEPFDGPFIDGPSGDPTTIELPDDSGDVGGGVSGGADFGTQCVAGSQKVINQALSHIGISKPIEDIVNEPTVEAQIARLHYQDDVEACLREFPWAFATAYVALILVAGTADVPLNDDWQYAYAVPLDMVLARRVVRRGVGRKYDPDPPEFRIGSGAFSNLIFTNEADAFLEYTFRPACAVSAGDALFREALGWRHSASLAPALSRNKVTAADCMAIYQQKAALATARNAGEQQQPPRGEAEWIRGRN